MLPIAEPTSLRKTLEVTKKGKTTDVTYGHIVEIDYCAKFPHPSQNGRYYVFYRCYRIAKHGKTFFEKGDSGSGVFLIDNENSILKPLGIGFLKGKWAYVCKIKHVLDRFQLTICKDEFASNFFTSEREEE